MNKNSWKLGTTVIMTFLIFLNAGLLLTGHYGRASQVSGTLFSFLMILGIYRWVFNRL